MRAADPDRYGNGRAAGTVVAPVPVPAMIQLGFDSLHFAILMIVLLAAFPALSTWIPSLLD